MTHDYKRHGTTTLFAVLNTLDGKVLGDCMPQHRHQEFIRFLKHIDQETPREFELHLIVDHYVLPTSTPASNAGCAAIRVFTCTLRALLRLGSTWSNVGLEI